MLQFHSSRYYSSYIHNIDSVFFQNCKFWNFFLEKSWFGLKMAWGMNMLIWPCPYLCPPTENTACQVSPNFVKAVHCLPLRLEYFSGNCSNHRMNKLNFSAGWLVSTSQLGLGLWPLAAVPSLTASSAAELLSRPCFYHFLSLACANFSSSLPLLVISLVSHSSQL